MALTNLLLPDFGESNRTEDPLLTDTHESKHIDYAFCFVEAWMVRR